MLVRRWVHDHGAAWQRREIQLRHDDGRWRVKRVGQVHEPAVEYPSQAEAVAAVLPLPDGWVETQADRSPPIRYGIP